MLSPMTQPHDEGDPPHHQDPLESNANSSLTTYNDIISNPFINQPWQQHPSVAPISPTVGEIPLIDMAGLFDPARRSDTMGAIHTACLEWGFFQVINHEVPQNTMRRMRECVEEFLFHPVSEQAPDSVKKVVVGGQDGGRRSYQRPKTTTRNLRDYFLLHTYPEYRRNYQTWPSNPTFREVIDEYCKDLKQLSKILLACLSENLGLPSSTYIEEALGEFHQDLVINHYSPCPQPKLAIGVGKHTDLGALTCLWQETEDVNGLQVLKDGEWVSVNPVPGAYIINVADQVEVISNGIYKSVEHRVVLNNTQKRISIATFYVMHPKLAVKPALELVTHNCPLLYPPTLFVDHARKLNVHMDKNGDKYLD